MSLTKLLENKTRAFVLGAALGACGEDQPDNITYVINTEEDKQQICQEMYQHIIDCDGFSLSKNPEAKKQKTLNGCLEDGHLYPPEFFECIFQQCGPKMIGSCDQYLDDIDFCYKTPVEEGGCKE